MHISEGKLGEYLWYRVPRRHDRIGADTGFRIPQLPQSRAQPEHGRAARAPDGRPDRSRSNGDSRLPSARGLPGERNPASTHDESVMAGTHPFTVASVAPIARAVVD
jgi:hypothetical protein